MNSINTVIDVIKQCETIEELQIIEAIADTIKVYSKRIPEIKKYRLYRSNNSTFLVSLWINNQLDNYKYQLHLAQKVIGKYDDYREQTVWLAHALRSWIESEKPKQNNCLWVDLIDAAIADVNWFEIAKEALETALDYESEE